jgi:hypothetical protein
MAGSIDGVFCHLMLQFACYWRWRSNAASMPHMARLLAMGLLLLMLTLGS